MFCVVGQYIDKSVSIRNMFNFARSAQVLSANATYCSDLYGSNLWDLYATEVKLVWDLPRTTHTWVVDNLLSCNFVSAREKIMAGYVGFLSRLRSSLLGR